MRCIGCGGEDPGASMKWAAVSSRATREYTKQDRVFVPGHNLVLGDHIIPMDGNEQALLKHQCFQKCHVECTDPWCFCSGYLDGYDSADSAAICGDQVLCEFLCDHTEGCGSIDMHRRLDRCFLNHLDGSTHQDTLAADESYMVLTPRLDGNQETPHDSPPGSPPAPHLVEPVDHGHSWDRLLRFTDLAFPTGGTYKLCFCDALLTPTGRCATEEDYRVEVGTVHSSGVSCLVRRPELQRVSCAAQHHGALRCYAGMSAPEPLPPLLPAKPEPIEHEEIVEPLVLSGTFCAEEGGCATAEEADGAA